MVIINYIKDKNPTGLIARFYRRRKKSVFGLVLWFLLFVNWIPMVISITLLLTSAICWNFWESCSTFFWVSLGITAVVFLPWLLSGIINGIKEVNKDTRW